MEAIAMRIAMLVGQFPVLTRRYVRIIAQGLLTVGMKGFGACIASLHLGSIVSPINALSKSSPTELSNGCPSWAKCFSTWGSTTWGDV